MEVLHKEDRLADFICVGAKFPTLKKEQPISSRHLVMNRTGKKRKFIETSYLRTKLSFKFVMMNDLELKPEEYKWYVFYYFTFHLECRTAAYRLQREHTTT